MKSPIHCELQAGTLSAAREAALMTRSFTEIFTGDYLLSFARKANKLSTLT